MLAALFAAIYSYGDSLEETVFKNIDELNAAQKFDYISLIKNNKDELNKMYERTQYLLAQKDNEKGI